MSEEQKYNPFSEAPLCRVTEAVTLHELKCMFVSACAEYDKMSWFKFNHKFQLMGAAAMIEQLILWIERGKQ